MWLSHSNEPLSMWKNLWNLASKKKTKKKMLIALTRGHCCHSLRQPQPYQTLYFIFSSWWYHRLNEIMLFLINWGVLTTAPPNLFLVKISYVVQGAVLPLCLQHTGSLLISYLSGEAVIIWEWASTMDNYPGRRILTVEKIPLLVKLPEYIKTLASS